jgi:predicted dehydrogenase
MVAKQVAVCDMLALMEKYTGVKAYFDYRKMIDTEDLDCVFIATPSRFTDRIPKKKCSRVIGIRAEDRSS